jgi:hypothetical protein
VNLWAWIAEFPVQPLAIPATPATEQGDKGALSRVSQLSQGVQGEQARPEAPELSQRSQQSQPLGSSPACPEDDADDAREAFEERAAIMEYDGGLSRGGAERHAEEFRQQYARAREVREPPTSDTDRDVGVSRPRARGRARAREAEGVAPSDAMAVWGDMRPCTWCRNLMRSGRCMAAWRGELRAARDYEPTFPEQPQRCIEYRPNADDPERTSGRERWPELVAWQQRLNDAN